MSVDRTSAEVWASWFRCLSDGSRVLILNRLAVARRPMSVGEIVDAVDIGQPTVSHHLKILAETGFVLVEPHANSRLYRVNARCLAAFPSAADLVMGNLPRYEPVTCECPAPWQVDATPGDKAPGTSSVDRAPGDGTDDSTDGGRPAGGGPDRTAFEDQARAAQTAANRGATAT